jgi:hypothetical protein
MPTPLAKKLRIQAGQRLLIVNAPEGYIDSLEDLPEGITISEKPDGEFDFVHLFVKNSAQYAEFGPATVRAIKYDGLLWVSYPKRSSKVATDLSRDSMWELLADSGLRPVTQVSIDAVWSAVRFRPTELVGT